MPREKRAAVNRAREGGGGLVHCDPASECECQRWADAARPESFTFCRNAHTPARIHGTRFPALLTDYSAVLNTNESRFHRPVKLQKLTHRMQQDSSPGGRAL